jgi:hypothetical protein
MVDGNQVYVYETDGLGGVLTLTMPMFPACCPYHCWVTTTTKRYTETRGHESLVEKIHIFLVASTFRALVHLTLQPTTYGRWPWLSKV